MAMPNPKNCPVRTREAIDRYVADHCPVGGFLTAVLSNDLRSAVGQADDENLAHLPDIVCYLHWEVPASCWGSPKAVEKWLKG